MVERIKKELREISFWPQCRGRLQLTIGIPTACTLVAAMVIGAVCPKFYQQPEKQIYCLLGFLWAVFLVASAVLRDVLPKPATDITEMLRRDVVFVAVTCLYIALCLLIAIVMLLYP